MANSEDNDDSRGNLFVNDGSFMEMFRRLQEQQKHPVNQSVQEREKEDGSSAKSATSASEATNRRGESRQRTPQLTGKACNEKERTKEEEEWEKTGVKKYPPQTKPSQVAESSVFVKSCSTVANIHWARSKCQLYVVVCSVIVANSTQPALSEGADCHSKGHVISFTVRLT